LLLAGTGREGIAWLLTRVTRSGNCPKCRAWNP
jgi:hypothetical protein